MAHVCKTILPFAKEQKGLLPQAKNLNDFSANNMLSFKSSSRGLTLPRPKGGGFLLLRQLLAMRQSDVRLHKRLTSPYALWRHFLN